MTTLIGNPIILTTTGPSQIIDLMADEARDIRITDCILVDPTITGGTLSTNRLKTKEIYYQADSTTLGLNQLSRNEVLTQGTTTYFREQGISVSISNDASTVFAVAGGPYELVGGYHGGCMVYQSNTYLDFYLNNSFEYTTFTDDARAGEYSDISEDGTKIVFGVGDNDSSSDLQIFKYDGSNHIIYATIVSGGNICNISGLYVVGSDYDGSVNIYLDSGASYTLQQTIVSGSVSMIQYLKLINSDTLYYYYNLQLLKYTRVGTVWSNTATLATGVITSLEAYGTFVVCSTATSLLIYENDVLIQTIARASIVACCMNSTLIIYATATTIYVLTSVLGVWTHSTVNTTSTGIASLACNETSLIVGRPTIDTYGRTDRYRIDITFVEGLVDTNNVLLDNETDQNVLFQSRYGTATLVGEGTVRILSETNYNPTSSIILNSNTVTSVGSIAISDTTLSTSKITGSITTAGGLGVVDSIYGEKIVVGSGLASAPSITFHTNETIGAYVQTTNTIGIVAGAVKTSTLSIGNNVTLNKTGSQYLSILGTSAAPPYSFTSYTNTGHYASATSLVSSVLGTAVLTVNSNGTVLIPTGSTAGTCGYQMGFSNTGVFSGSLGTLGISCSSSIPMSFTSALITASVPFNSAVGSISAPTYSFTGDTGTGIYRPNISTVGVAINGALGLRIRPEGNSLASVSCGNTSVATSVNATLGSVFKVDANGTGKWAIEAIASGGATTLMSIVATTTQVGSITTNGTTTFYNTTSDEKLKKNILDIDSQIDKIMLVKPRKFKWKKDSSNDTGFIAQELLGVFPEAVTIGNYDPVTETGTPHMIDYSRIVPALVKTIQEQQVMIEKLTARVSALELV